MKIKTYKNIKNIFREIKKFKASDSAILQVSVVAVSTVFAQALNVLFLPLISRIYSPADYGVMSVYLAIVSILSELAGLRYYLAIPLPKSRRYAESLLYLSFIVQIFFVFFFSILLLVFGKIIFNYFSMEMIIPYMYYIPLGILAIGFYNILMQWSIRESAFVAIGKTKIAQSFAGSLTKIILGFYSIKPHGLLLGTVVAQAGGIFTLYKASIKKNKPLSFSKERIKRVMLRYRKMPLYNTWYGLISTMRGGVPLLFLSSLYEVQYAGLYGMASSLLLLPISFVGQAMGQVFIQRASVAKNSKNISTISLKACLLLYKIGVFPVALVSIFAPPLFSVFLGERWGAAGIYAIALVPFIANRFVFSPMSMLYLILEKQEVSLLHELLNLILGLMGLTLGLYWGNPVLSVLFFSIFSSFIQLYRILFLLHTAGNSRRVVVRQIAKILLESLMMLTLPALFLFFKVRIILLMIAALFSSLLYLYSSYNYLRSEKIIKWDFNLIINQIRLFFD